MSLISKKTINIIHLSALLLFGIVLKASLLFYMSKQIACSEFYAYHEWLNFALDSVAVFAGFYFLIKKVKRTWLQVALAALAAAYTYVCVTAEDLMFTYQFYSVWGNFNSGMVSVEYRGMAAELLDAVSSCSLMHIRTFVLLTAILCTFAILLSKDSVRQQTVSKRFIWAHLAFLIVIDCYLKTIAYYAAEDMDYDLQYRLFGAGSLAESLNYIFDVAIFLLLFAVLNIRIRKLVWKIVSIITLSLITTGIVMLENIAFLYHSDWNWYNYGNMTEAKYVVRYFTSAFTTTRPHYILVAFGFALACVAILICGIPKIKEKLISAWNSTLGLLASEADECDFTISFSGDDGNKITMEIEKFASIQIKSEDVDESLLVGKEKNTENMFYLCHVDKDGNILGDISVSNDMKEVYTAYGNFILLASELLFAGDEK